MEFLIDAGRAVIHVGDSMQCARLMQVEHVKNEVSLLSMIEHPAIVNM